MNIQRYFFLIPYMYFFALPLRFTCVLYSYFLLDIFYIMLVSLADAHKLTSMMCFKKILFNNYFHVVNIFVIKMFDGLKHLCSQK
jgi:hypothetical protein